MIWSLILIACTNTACMKQDIQWFEVKQQCIELKQLHEDLPQDGNWKSVKYTCQPVNGAET